MKKLVAGFTACAAFMSAFAWAGTQPASGNGSAGAGQGTAVQGAQDAQAQWVSAVKSFIEKELDEGEVDNDLAALKRTDLPATAQKQYDRYKRIFAPDYVPSAYKVNEVPGGTAYLLVENTDGGTYLSVFDASGKLVASAAVGESDDFSWDGTPRAFTTP